MFERNPFSKRVSLWWPQPDPPVTACLAGRERHALLLEGGMGVCAAQSPEPACQRGGKRAEFVRSRGGSGEGVSVCVLPDSLHRL